MSTIRITIRFFAAARDLAGCESAVREVSANCTVADLRRELAAEFPPLASLLGHSMLAVGRAYAADAAVLDDGTEIAVIPPVSGG
ncbi:MAG: MoaD/ThiS family protein [Pirellulales bacterium]